MNKPPPRLLDDPSVSPSIKEDLSKIRSVPPGPFDLEAGLKRFQSSVNNQTSASDSNVDSATSSTHQTNPTYMSSSVTGLGTKIWVAMTLSVASIAMLVGYFQYEGSKPKPDNSIEPNQRTTNSTVETSTATSRTTMIRDKNTGHPLPNNPVPKKEENKSESKATDELDPVIQNAISPADKSRLPKKNQPAIPLNSPSSLRKKTVTATPASQDPRSAAVSTQDEIDPDLHLREEIAQLAEARRLLSTDPLQALNLAKRGQKTFSNGMFMEEREAITVFALDRLQKKTETMERATRFLKKYPNGPFSERIRELIPELNRASDLEKVGRQ